MEKVSGRSINGSLANVLQQREANEVSEESSLSGEKKPVRLLRSFRGSAASVGKIMGHYGNLHRRRQCQQGVERRGQQLLLRLGTPISLLPNTLAVISGVPGKAPAPDGSAAAGIAPKPTKEIQEF